MIHEGVILKGRHLAIQHGAGRVIVDFWRDAMHLYNLLGKVSGDILDLDIISDVTKIASLVQYPFQFKYRIQAHRKIAMAEGVLGKRVQVDSTYNIFFNETGMVNGCTAGDLKVTRVTRLTRVTRVTRVTRLTRVTRVNTAAN